MSDDPEKAAKQVSMTKPAAGGAGEAPGQAPRPRQVQGAVAALAASALAALIAAISLYGQRAWLTREQIKADHKAKKPVPSASTLHHQISQQQSGALIGTIIVVAAIAVLAVSVYRGRYWSRWGVVAFWLLASFTGTVVGVGTVLSVGSSVPAGFKVPAFLAGAFLIVAVVLVNFRVSTEYFALTRPDRSDMPQRRGLFAPRTPPASGRGPAGARPGAAKGILTSSAATRGEAYVERQRSKKRAAANQESVARGAELARSRAKASKSRRIER